MISKKKYPEPEMKHVELSDEQKIKIDKIAEEFKRSLLNGFDPTFDRKEIESEMKKIKREDEISQSNISYSKGYKGPSEEQLLERKLKREWALKFHELNTGKRLDNWISFDEWLKTNQ